VEVSFINGQVQQLLLRPLQLPIWLLVLLLLLLMLLLMLPLGVRMARPPVTQGVCQDQQLLRPVGHRCARWWPEPALPQGNTPWQSAQSVIGGAFFGGIMIPVSLVPTQ